MRNTKTKTKTKTKTVTRKPRRTLLQKSCRHAFADPYIALPDDVDPVKRLLSRANTLRWLRARMIASAGQETHGTALVARTAQSLALAAAWLRCSYAGVFTK